MIQDRRRHWIRSPAAVSRKLCGSTSERITPRHTSAHADAILLCRHRKVMVECHSMEVHGNAQVTVVTLTADGPDSIPLSRLFSCLLWVPSDSPPARVVCFSGSGSEGTFNAHT